MTSKELNKKRKKEEAAAKEEEEEEADIESIRKEPKEN